MKLFSVIRIYISLEIWPNSVSVGSETDSYFLDKLSQNNSICLQNMGNEGLEDEWFYLPLDQAESQYLSPLSSFHKIFLKIVKDQVKKICTPFYNLILVWKFNWHYLLSASRDQQCLWPTYDVFFVLLCF